MSKFVKKSRQSPATVSFIFSKEEKLQRFFNGVYFFALADGTAFSLSFVVPANET